MQGGSPATVPQGIAAQAAAQPTDEPFEALPQGTEAEAVGPLPARAVHLGWSNLVDQLGASCGLRGQALEAMRSVDRGDFVCRSAYEDIPVSIGHRATISAPHMHARALKLLEKHLRPGSRALDVGCGSGYFSAVMAHLVGPSGIVVGIDYLEPLVELSRSNVGKSDAALLRGSKPRLMLEVGDGWKGRPEEGPFDAIHVGAAAAEIPHALLEQLKPGGRMVIPVGKESQVFMQVDRGVDGRFSYQNLLDVRYVPLVRV